ncbi:MAG: type II toxin-antitoxin system YafQ family toxin [Firmicutes bacterium]|nr:type II toxin-antitoxin system YafQ family toxin [Bacillota bacterium]
MLNIRITNEFKKNYQTAVKRGLDIGLLDNVIKELRQGKKLDKKYKNHTLKGEYNGFQECHIQPDWLLVYDIDENEITLVATGSHSDLFR